jgi:hypothetical protein
VSPELLDRVATVGSFRDQRHIRLDSNETGDAFAHQRMVVDHQNSNPRAAAAHEASPPAVCGRLPGNRRDHQERLPDVAYTLLAGRRSSTSVPAPTSLHTASFPPISAARSGIPRSP